MNTITMVRIYLTEHEETLTRVLDYLHNEAKVHGVTVFRGISGFGPSGKMHEVSWSDLSTDLPVVVEFFDQPDAVNEVLIHLNTIAEPSHTVFWPAQVMG